MEKLQHAEKKNKTTARNKDKPGIYMQTNDKVALMLKVALGYHVMCNNKTKRKGELVIK